eukprot:COSAG02_NODE_1152_length_14201_cov_9.055595_2_plen_96_part_00
MGPTITEAEAAGTEEVTEEAGAAEEPTNHLNDMTLPELMAMADEVGVPQAEAHAALGNPDQQAALRKLIRAREPDDSSGIAAKLDEELQKAAATS